MDPQPITSPLARAAIAVLCVMWTMAGWYTLLTSQFSTSSKRSNITTTVNGLGAEFLGAVFIALGLIALALLLQGFKLSRLTRAMALLLLLVAAPLVLKVLFDVPGFAATAHVG